MTEPQPLPTPRADAAAPSSASATITRVASRPTKRQRPAQAARILTAGLSTTAVIGLATTMAWSVSNAHSSAKPSADSGSATTLSVVPVSGVISSEVNVEVAQPVADTNPASIVTAAPADPLAVDPAAPPSPVDPVSTMAATIAPVPVAPVPQPAPAVVQVAVPTPVAAGAIVQSNNGGGAGGSSSPSNGSSSQTG